MERWFIRGSWPQTGGDRENALRDTCSFRSAQRLLFGLELVLIAQSAWHMPSDEVIGFASTAEKEASKT